MSSTTSPRRLQAWNTRLVSPNLSPPLSPLCPQSSIILLLTLVASLTVSAQFSANPPRRGKTIIIPLPKDKSGEDVYPDCNKGKVCLPEALQCAERQRKVGATQFQDKTYWFSWQSNEDVLRKARWNWFTARNYCRKRCMDLVSFVNSVNLRT